MKTHPNIALIIPIYNPVGDWVNTLVKRYNEFCNTIGFEVDLILVNDGSPNDLSARFNEISLLLHDKSVYILSYNVNRGKGGALKVGATSAVCDLYIFTDYDFPYTVQSMHRLCRALIEKRGIVVGHRPDTYYEGVGNFRTNLSKTLRRLTIHFL